MSSKDSHYDRVPLKSIYVNPHQPRKVFQEKDLEDLCQSIKSVGLIHPPTVLEKERGRYELVSGERRFRACERLGMKELPVYICHFSPDLSAQAALVENIQRVDLNPLEVALAMKKMMLSQDLTQEALAKVVGKKRSTVANYLRLLSLSQDIQKALTEEKITMGHAKVLLSLECEKAQKELLEQVVGQQMSVREAEMLAKQRTFLEKSSFEAFLHKKKGPTVAKGVEIEIQDLQRRLQEDLGRKVTVNARKDGSGQLVLDYYSLDDFDSLLQRLDSQFNTSV